MKANEKRNEKEADRIEKLSSRSELIDYHRIGPSVFLIHFRCKGLIDDPRAGLEITSHHVVSVTVPEGRGEQFGPESVTFVRPGNIFHPNIRPPSIALKSYLKGKTIDELCQRIYDVITYRNYDIDGPDCVNPDAADWAKGHPDELPLDPRPLVEVRRRRRKSRPKN